MRSNSLLLIFCAVKRNKPRAWITWFIAGFVLLSVACSRPTKQPNQNSGRPTANEPGQQTLSGRVVRIADGDTITVLDASNTHIGFGCKALMLRNPNRFWHVMKKKLSG
jgi:hypothetical protein